MIGAVLILTLLPSFISCSGDGNIRILEDEIANALRACTAPTNDGLPNQRQRRSNKDQYVSRSRIDDNLKSETNQYGHEKRGINNTRDQNYVINSTDYGYDGYNTEDAGTKQFTAVTQSVPSGNASINRTRRNDPLLNKGDSDQCLSQCVFANLQVVDSRGIPREVELWNKIQSSVTSQQSRSALRDQIRACFQELQSEAEDNGCSYSNKLERCLMLRFSDRKITNAQNT
uniref:Odorant Binding Protein 48 n=1 Tax=Dendrolimus punctatus TaxID=238572 RepID=A0A2K8GKP8_9NEOP|nr:Odorant Binding Protein 48 [Dendrolimus punctatus]